jgi:hypothetical protein
LFIIDSIPADIPTGNQGRTALPINHSLVFESSWRFPHENAKIYRIFNELRIKSKKWQKIEI